MVERIWRYCRWRLPQNGDAFNVYRYPTALCCGPAGSAAIVALTSVNIWLIARAIQPDGISLLEVFAINPIIVLLAGAAAVTGRLGVRQGFAATCSWDRGRSLALPGVAAAVHRLSGERRRHSVDARR